MPDLWDNFTSEYFRLFQDKVISSPNDISYFTVEEHFPEPEPLISSHTLTYL